MRQRAGKGIGDLRLEAYPMRMTMPDRPALINESGGVRPREEPKMEPIPGSASETAAGESAGIEALNTSYPPPPTGWWSSPRWAGYGGQRPPMTKKRTAAIDAKRAGVVVVAKDDGTIECLGGGVDGDASQLFGLRSARPAPSCSPASGTARCSCSRSRTVAAKSTCRRRRRRRSGRCARRTSACSR